MTLKEAIKHLNETLNQTNKEWCNDDCKREHIQLREWLIELKERRDKELKK